MRIGPYQSLLHEFNANWKKESGSFEVLISGGDVTIDSDHLWETEIRALCEGRAASLPYFNDGKILWCSLARDPLALREHISILRAWILPSYGDDLGFVGPPPRTSPLAQAVFGASPHGYFRWRCPRQNLDVVARKLATFRKVEATKPLKQTRVRPSLFQLRAEFSAALVVGDRAGAEAALNRIEELQLDTAQNTLFLRIRLWQTFREFDRISGLRELPRLKTQGLPPRVAEAIDEAMKEAGMSLVVSPPSTPAIPESVSATESWKAWVKAVRAGDGELAEETLAHRPPFATTELKASEITTLVEALEELFMDSTALVREREQIGMGLAELLGDLVREADFPRPTFAAFYAALLGLWAELYAGTSTSREHGHVLLELAGACLTLNYKSQEAIRGIDRWWKEKRSLSQLPFLLDALELLARELPDSDSLVGLWIDAADLIRRTPDGLGPSDKAIWRGVGERLGMSGAEIVEYLPLPNLGVPEADPLTILGDKRVAIVCMRERQAEEAATVITKRCGAKVLIVDGKTVGPSAQGALTCDVILFVWMATTHAVFRALDRIEKRKLCYVQGTGGSSIIRALERWCVLQAG